MQKLPTTSPEVSYDAEFFPGMPKKWGLTWLINTEDVPGRRSAGSLAWAGMFNSYYWLDPKKQVTGLLMTQILPFADPTVLGLLDEFETEVYRTVGDAMMSDSNANPYLALGVRPFINCCSVRTMHGGSLMLPEVRAAVDAASRQFVNLDELMEAAGARLAELTGAEWGIVTCGSAAAVALASAACVAGNDPVRMLRLPFTDGWVNRVILPKNQRFAYDQAIRMVGAHIVEIELVAELDAALTEPVAMVAILGTNEEFSKVRLEEIVARVKPLGIPILVDAASEHLQRPSPWLVRGADMVVYSGGKFLRGPQTSGLLLGKKNLVQAAWRNASPHQAFGRPMKVSKEDVIGVLTAVDYWFNKRDEAAELRKWHADLKEIARPRRSGARCAHRGHRTERRGPGAAAAGAHGTASRWMAWPCACGCWRAPRASCSMTRRPRRIR